MLIGIVHPGFTTVGGAELLVARYAAWLRDMGHEIRLVTMELDRERWPQLAGMDVRVVGKRWTDGLGVPGSFPKLRRRAARQANALRGVDVVLAGNYPGTVVAAQVEEVPRSIWMCMEPNRRLHPRETFRALAARVDATPRAHDSALLAAGRQLLERHAVAVLAGREIVSQRTDDIDAVRRISSVVAISGYSGESVRCVYGRSADAIIHPTVDPVTTPRRTPGIDPAGLRLLVHGRLDLLKNVETVLRGFAAFRARHPGAHELHVVGAGPDLARLRAIALECGLATAARFHGYLPAAALEAVYQRCEVMALLPPDEPFGMVYPEAAHRGLLLIGPDHGGPFEILDGGALGWTLDIFTPEPLADALAEAWRLPTGEVERRREAAAAACRDRYRPEATLPALLAQLTNPSRC